MVTNINLSSPEISEKKSFSGKPALVFSVLLLVIVFALFFTLSFLKSRYLAENEAVSQEISAEQSKISGPAFSDIFDFQERLNLVDKVIDDHAYWDSLLKRMSAYVIPEVKLQAFSGKKDSSGGGTIELIGTASNLDAISRQLLLLKDFPDLDSLEFKNVGEAGAQEGQPSGLTFEVSLKMNKTAFQR